ncbi:Hypothetical predicted protein [Mytilus galloprovincialis]|uniref:Uncharacterized protein n=2 Tax=Mytilus galloprovincialis TaxID=29158 RepID=A0A8B6E119_MYTGA|nr:Hypothetical predicted protein [Mytilus galloprovincialis]
MLSIVFMNTVFVMLSLVSQADGSCFASQAGPGINDCTAPNGAHVGNGKNYESYDECISCDCDNGYLNCCQMGMTLSGLHPDCKAVADGPCFEKAVLKNNENKPCPYRYGGTGR